MRILQSFHQLIYTEKLVKKKKKLSLLHWFVYFKGFAYRCTFLKAVTSKYNNISHSCTSCTSH